MDGETIDLRPAGVGYTHVAVCFDATVVRESWAWISNPGMKERVKEEEEREMEKIYFMIERRGFGISMVQEPPETENSVSAAHTAVFGKSISRVFVCYMLLASIVGS